MKNFVILTDSCSDLDKRDREKYNIKYVKMHFTCEQIRGDADLDWEKVSFKDFYDIMRNGTRIITSQINAEEYKIAFEQILNEGYDILYIGCSSALSSSVNASFVARNDMLERHPDSKIYCIDTLNACMGEGLLCITASKLRAQGKSIEEVAAWVEENKMFVHQEATVDKLTWLKMAGRVSAASAFFGGILNIKPIIVSDTKGANVAVEKVKGRKNSFVRIGERVKSSFVERDYQEIYVVHGDCEDEAKEFAEEIKKILPENAKNIQINIRRLGPIIGASCGPGTLGVYYFGNRKTDLG